ncbi:MAG TPA: energy transducer TonB [Pyrinomonadaceae bacterium]|jgi:TonB family protein|nr:energy transducer TonB [Pyrinomonadaceae bacterium]
MKQCSTCKEEFADKFGFCPVDGTPLAVAVVAPESADAPDAPDESFMTVSARGANGNGSASSEEFPHVEEETVSSGAAPHGPRGEYHLTFLEDEGLTRRLMREVKAATHEAELTWPEFKKDPVGFTKRTGYATGALVKKFFRQDYAVPAVIAPFCVALLIAGAWLVILNTDRCFFARILGTPCVPIESTNPYENLEVVSYVENEVPKEQPTPDKGTAGLNEGKGGGSKPKQEKPGGGGGGGRQDQTPASQGKLPTAQLEVPPILTANPNPPKITQPHLPTPVTIQLDPLLAKNDPRPIPYGDPRASATIPSSGTGRGGGMGDGTGGGVGTGNGTGYGPGNGYNTGGGDAHEGGGGAGGGGGGAPEDYRRTFKPAEVTRKAVITAKPEPGFTEEARKNNVTGTVRLRAVLSASGSVQGISVVKGLPDGLTEKAISAAKNIRFTPAQKDGRTVSQYVTLEYNFNIY